MEGGNYMNSVKENYVERIKNATPVQLIVITFELVLVNIEDARENIHDNEKFELHIRKAQDFLMQLMTSLDMSYQISSELLNLYLYANKLLHNSYFSKDLIDLDEATEILDGLLESFFILAQEELGSGINDQLFSSYTYNKNGMIDEVFFDDVKTEYRA